MDKGFIVVDNQRTFRIEILGSFAKGVILFAHLHLHTKYSLLDSTLKIDELMRYIQQLGQTAVAITDHGNLYGAVEFYKMALERNIKPIIGCEVYICSDVTIMKRENRMYHLILLCKNETGRINLQKLVSESTKYKFNKKPRIDFDMLKKHKDGLICLSACMAGEVSDAIRNKEYNLAYQTASRYKELFDDDYYIELQAHNDELQKKINKQLIFLAKRLNVKTVVTCDSHYLRKEDQKYHNIYVQIGQTREVGETYNDCYVQSESEVLSNCYYIKDIQKSIDTTQEIVEKCDVNYPLSAPIIPHVSIPKQYGSEVEYLKALCNEGMRKRGFFEWSLQRWKKYLSETIYDKDGVGHEREIIHIDNTRDAISMYKKRAQYELDAVIKMSFEGYYLLVHSYIFAAKRRGIARGSAGGSLLAYLCGIVDIDPIKYGLYFERFIDVGALDLLKDGKIIKKELKIPDVDADFSTDDRGKVMKFIVDRYHSDNVVALGQFGYIWAKGAIKDIGKVLDIPFSVTNEMTKRLNDETIDEALELGLLDEYKDKYPELFDYASKISGLPKSHGMHPCGKVISMKEASYYNALEYDSANDVWVLEGDMHTADDLGLVKIDLLGLRTLNIIYDVLEMIGRDYDYIAPHNINLCDQSVWAEFANGNTAEIFQFESLGMRNVLRQMNCNCMEDLIAANALYRPGSKVYISNYINRKNGTEEIEYINKGLEQILRATYGIIVYQEQLIEIGRLAGLSNPDELRKATAKKKPKLMAKIEPEMKNGLISRGWTQDEVNQLWDDIIRFAKYSFNRAHAAAYALTAYITMFLKVHHPCEFITAAINSYDGSVKDIVNVIEEGKRLRVKYGYDRYCDIPPRTVYDNGFVHLGVDTIKGLGSNVSEELRQFKGQEFDDFASLLRFNADNKCVGKAVIEVLVKLGMFSEFGYIEELLHEIDIFNKFYQKKRVSIEILESYGLTTDMFDSFAQSVTEKNVMIANSYDLILKIIERTKIDTQDIIQRIQYSNELLGYVNVAIPEVDENLYYVTNVDGNTSRIITIVQLKTGQYEVHKIRKAAYDKNPVREGSMIRIIELLRDKKWKCEIGKDGKQVFTRTNEDEIVLSRWMIIK